MNRSIQPDRSAFPIDMNSNANKLIPLLYSDLCTVLTDIKVISLLDAEQLRDQTNQAHLVGYINSLCLHRVITGIACLIDTDRNTASIIKLLTIASKSHSSTLTTAEIENDRKRISPRKNSIANTILKYRHHRVAHHSFAIDSKTFYLTYRIGIRDISDFVTVLNHILDKYSEALIGNTTDIQYPIITIEQITATIISEMHNTKRRVI